MPEGNVLALRLSLMGRPVRSYKFNKPVVTVGRDPDADIFVENPGVSREHLRFEKTPEDSYEVVDLGSANGTFLNDLPVKVKITLRNGDSVRFGKYTLAVSYEQDRRTRGTDEHPSGGADSQTMVLSRVELNHLLDLQVKAQAAPPPVPPAGALKAHAPAEMAAAAALASAAASERPAANGFSSAVAGFVLGAAAGALTMWFVFH